MAVEINIFYPSKAHAKQLEVLNDPARFKLLRAGRKWRKTSLGVSWLLEQALLCTQGLTYPFILPYQNQARDTVWRDHVARLEHELVNKKVPYKKNEQEMSLTFPNQARKKLYGSDNKTALLSASNWGALVVDEIDSCQPDLWELVLRPNLMTHKAPSIVMGTPKGMLNM